MVLSYGQYPIRYYVVVAVVSYLGTPVVMYDKIYSSRFIVHSWCLITIKEIRWPHHSLA